MQETNWGKELGGKGALEKREVDFISLAIKVTGMFELDGGELFHLYSHCESIICSIKICRFI